VKFRNKYCLWLLSAIICFCSLYFGCETDTTPTQDYLFPLAEEQNIDSEQLKLAFNNARQIRDLQGLAIARNFIIVAEEYYNQAGTGPDSLIHVMSVTKSFSSTLIGIAIDKGIIQDVNQNVSLFLGAEVNNANPALGQVTIHQLLTMTCGHEWREIDEPSEFVNFVNADDQLTYIFRKPIVNTPRMVFDYSDGSAHLISAIITNATGQSAEQFANENLFGPMGLGPRKWTADNRGISYGSVRLHIGIHDMIKFGYLYLNEGTFNEIRIVSSDWIDTATTPYKLTNNVLPYLSHYGYYWWLGHVYNHDFFCAMGYGGQFVLVSKELNLVIAARCNWRGLSEQQASENWWAVFDIIINQILPAVY
jgi:CubicO group peptidase (beta-lactamase class C family)